MLHVFTTVLQVSCPSSQGTVLDSSVRPTCLFRLHESPTILHKTLTAKYQTSAMVNATVNATVNVLDTRNTVSPHRHSIQDFFYAPFPWNTDQTFTFTENTDICCYKKELLTLLVFLICSDINRLKDDCQDFRLSTRCFQQFLA